MTDRTLKELSDASKAFNDAGESQSAHGCLAEAIERFPQTPAEGETERRLEFDAGGSITIVVVTPYPRIGGFREEHLPLE